MVILMQTGRFRMIASLLNNERRYHTCDLQNENDPEESKSSASDPRTEVITEWYCHYRRRKGER